MVSEYKEIVCRSWQKFAQLGSDPGFHTKNMAFKNIWMRIHDENRNGIEFVDVKGHPSPEPMILQDQHLRTLIIDLSEVVAFKNITFLEISKASALKFVNQNFFKLFNSLDDSVKFYSLENLRKIPYIPIPVGWGLTVKRLFRLEVIKGCGREICTNYEKLRHINILIGKSYTKVLAIENSGLDNRLSYKRFLNIRIAIVEPRVQIDTNIFRGSLFKGFDYQTFGSMNILDLNDSLIWVNKGFLSSKTASNENLLGGATLIHSNKILPNFHSPFFYNHDDMSKLLKLKGVPANTLVSVISVIPTLNATALDYKVCTDISTLKQTFTIKDTKRTLRYTSADISDALEKNPNYVTDLIIYTLHAVISKDVTITVWHTSEISLVT